MDDIGIDLGEIDLPDLPPPLPSFDDGGGGRGGVRIDDPLAGLKDFAEVRNDTRNRIGYEEAIEKVGKKRGPLPKIDADRYVFSHLATRERVG